MGEQNNTPERRQQSRLYCLAIRWRDGGGEHVALLFNSLFNKKNIFIVLVQIPLSQLQAPHLFALSTTSNLFNTQGAWTTALLLPRSARYPNYLDMAHGTQRPACSVAPYKLSPPVYKIRTHDQ